MKSAFVVICLGLLLGVPCIGQSQSQRNSTIAGRITDADGKPIDATVIAYARPIEDGKRGLVAMFSAPTDENGYYECSHIPAGSYVVSALVNAGIATSSSETPKPKITARVFYPNTFDIGSAENVSIGPGATQTANIIVGPIDATTVIGQVGSHPANPSFRLLAHSPDSNLPVERLANYDMNSGDFRIADIPLGTYLLTVDWVDRSAPHHAEAVFTLDSDKQQEVRLQEIYRHELAGRIVDVDADSFGPRGYPENITLEGTGARSGWSMSAPISRDGTFHFSSIADGQYLIRTADSSGYYVSTTAVGKDQHDGPKLRISGTENTISLRIDLMRTRSVVSGVLPRESFRPKQSGLTLWSMENGDIRITRVDGNGNFRFIGIPSGHYRLYGWIDLNSAEYRNVTLLKRLRDSSTELSVDKETHMSDLAPSLISNSSE